MGDRSTTAAWASLKEGGKRRRPRPGVPVPPVALAGIGASALHRVQVCRVRLPDFLVATGFLKGHPRFRTSCRECEERGRLRVHSLEPPLPPSV